MSLIYLTSEKKSLKLIKLWRLLEFYKLFATVQDLTQAFHKESVSKGLCLETILACFPEEIFINLIDHAMTRTLIYRLKNDIFTLGYDFE